MVNQSYRARHVALEVNGLFFEAAAKRHVFLDPREPLPCVVSKILPRDLFQPCVGVFPCQATGIP